MIMKIFLGTILTLYSVLSLFAFIKDKEMKKHRPRLTFGIISCVLILISGIGIFVLKGYFQFVLVIGILLLHVLAIMNGYLLYGKPNWSHHGLRLVFSIIIVTMYFVFL